MFNITINKQKIAIPPGIKFNTSQHKLIAQRNIITKRELNSKRR